jgi:flagellar biosynthesis protein FliQ
MLRRVVRFLIRTAILVAANAVGLLVAAAVLDDMTVDGTSFIEAIIIFTVAVALMTPFMANVLRKRQSSALGGVALIAGHHGSHLRRLHDRGHLDLGGRHRDRLGRVPVGRVHPAVPRAEEVSRGSRQPLSAGPAMTS